MSGDGDRRIQRVLELMLATGRVPGRAGRLLSALAAGTLLPSLDAASLERLDELYYERAVMYRADSWNEQGLFAWERELVDGAVAPGARMAVLGCGGGREVLGLLDAGYDPTGYESHPLLSSYAEDLLARHGFPGRIERIPRDRFPPGGTFDAVLIGWGTLSLVWPKVQRLELLREVGDSVRGRGTIILSAFVRRSWGRDLRLVHRLANRRWRARVEEVERGDTLAPNRVHVFTPEQLHTELRAAGWEPEPVRFIRASGVATGYGCVIGRRA